MRKIVSILLVLCVLFALCACNSASSDTEKTTIPNPDVEPVSIDDVSLGKYLDNCAYFGRCNWNDFTREEQLAISNKARDAQVTLNISDDGVIKLIDLSGLVIEYGGNWPSENALIENFPIPENKVAYYGNQTGVMCYIGIYMSMDEAREYAKNFASIGFDKGVTETENDKTYYYDAENSEGNMAIIVYEAGITLISVMPSGNE